MTNSDFIAAAALIVAVMAMLATFWQAHVARTHGRLSVRPHLDWGTDRFPGKPVALYLLNSGLGPALIESFTLSIDGKKFPIDSLELPDEIRREVSAVAGLTEWNLFSKGTPIASGIRINLFHFENHAIGIQPHNQALHLLDRIGIEISYSSVYGEKFNLHRD